MDSKCLYNSSITVHQGWYVIVLLYKAFEWVDWCQWHNSRWVGAESPLTLLTGKFLLTYWEKRGKEKRENREKRRKIKKRRGDGKLKMEGWKVIKWGEDHFLSFFCSLFLFLFLFVFFLFVFCLFVFAFHLSKPLKFVLGLPKWKFSIGKKNFTPGKNSGKKRTLPLWKIFLLCPLLMCSLFLWIWQEINSLCRHAAWFDELTAYSAHQGTMT